MRIIDSHVHLYPEEINRDPAAWAAKNREAHWATLCTRRRKNGAAVQAFPSVAQLLHQMDTDGIERAILLGWYWQHAESAQRQNSFFRDCICAHPDRLSACASWHPDLAPAPFVRRLRDDGMVGIGELSPHTQSELREPAAREAWQNLFAEASRHALPVNLHVTEPDAAPYPGKTETPPADFIAWAEAFPATPFIWAHWGARFALHPALAEKVRGLTNVFFDTAASPLIYREASPWRAIVDAVGAERVLFGSDYPLVLFPRESEDAEFSRLVREARSAEAGLTPAEQATILHGNATRLWRL